MEDSLQVALNRFAKSWCGFVETGDGALRVQSDESRARVLGASDIMLEKVRRLAVLGEDELRVVGVRYACSLVDEVMKARNRISDFNDGVEIEG